MIISPPQTKNVPSFNGSLVSTERSWGYLVARTSPVTARVRGRVRKEEEIAGAVRHGGHDSSASRGASSHRGGRDVHGDSDGSRSGVGNHLAEQRGRVLRRVENTPS